MSPDDGHVYVTSASDNALVVFSRDGGDGHVSQTQIVFDGDPGIDGLTGASGVAVSPDGKHVYTVAVGDSAVTAWSRDESTGAVTLIEVEVDGDGGVDGLAGAHAVAISPDGEHVYVAGRDDDAIAVFSRDLQTGALLYLDSELDGEGGNEGLVGAEAVAVSPDGKHVYVASEIDGSVAVFERETNYWAPDFGELTFVEAQFDEVGGNDGLAGAGSLAMDSNGANVYVASERGMFNGIAGGDWIAVFSRSASTGELSFVETFDESDFSIFDGCIGIGNDSSAIAVSPDDGLVFVTNPFRGTVASFTRDPQDGSLTFLDSVCDRSGSGGLAGTVGIALTADGARAYATSPSYQTLVSLCTGGPDLDLTDAGVVDDARTEIGCRSITAGGGSDGYEIVEPGAVTFQTPSADLTPGFRVVLGAAFNVDVAMGQAASGDPLAPTPAITFPSEGDGVLPGLTVTIAYRVEHHELVDSYQLLADGVVLDAQTGVDQFSVEGSTSWAPPGTAQIGDTFEIRWEVTDVHGKTGVDRVTVEVPSGTHLDESQELDSSRDGQALVLAAGTYTVTEPIALLSLNLVEGARLTSVAEEPLDLSVTGLLRVGSGAEIDVSELGYPGGEAPGFPGGAAPPWVSGSLETAGGSHGGVGSEGETDDPAGEVYDSVYRPALAGGGAGPNWWDSDRGTNGGGAVILSTGELVLEGTIRARGGDTAQGETDTATGAGGTVAVTADAMSGAGVIDASGGNISVCNADDGVGGGGRVALHVEELDGFDPLAQITAWGGVNNCDPTNPHFLFAAPGTVLLSDAVSVYGALMLDAGEFSDGTDRESLVTELPPLGSGAVVATEVAGGDRWVTASEPFRIRWVGAWMALANAAGGDLGTFQVAEVDGAGRALLTGAGSAAGAAAYQGEYRFDRIDQRNGAGLTASDPVSVGELVVDSGASVLPSSLTATDLTIKAGAMVLAGQQGSFTAQVSGTMTIEAGAVLDATGQGYPGGVSSGSPEGGAPPGVSGSLETAGGSHGGAGAEGTEEEPAGEEYDSVYKPSLGGGGAGHSAYLCCDGTPGGGVVTLEVGTLVLDGEIHARGATTGASDTATGAGGTVAVTASALSGGGRIDVSGGGLSFCNTSHGVGGGGRVALEVDDLGSFDAATQVVAWGGVNSCSPTNPAFLSAAPGTAYILSASGIYGELFVGHADPAHTGAPHTVLPTLGAGNIGVTEPDAADPTALWIEAEEIVPGQPVLFDLGVVGMWVRVDGVDYQVVDQSADRVRLLLAQGTGAVWVGDAYEGVYKLDRLVVTGGATLEVHDLLEVPVVQVDEDSSLITPLGDVQPPRVTIVMPDDETSEPEILVSYQDPDTGSGEEGIDTSSLVLEVDGQSVVGDCQVSTGLAWCELPSLGLGAHSLLVEVFDLASNSTTVTGDFTLLPPGSVEFRAIADCSPSTGAAPLSVMFRSRGEFTGGAIDRYRWDFDGDGAWDKVDGVPMDYLHQFGTQGDRVSVLEVRNNLGEKALDYCPILVDSSAPTVRASVTPSNGPAPLLVGFTCTGEDIESPIELYEWDFDGDGSYDFESQTSGDTTFTYLSAGEFEAVCRVTDADGQQSLAPTAETKVRVTPPGTPIVEAIADPTEGVAPLEVSFSGTATDDGTIVKWEWDFEGDGTVDYLSTTSPDTEHIYTAGGTYAATLRAEDDQGLGGLDEVAIYVDADAELSIPDDTFDPSVAETVAIETSIHGDAAVRILIRDRDRVDRRVLVDEFRAAGDYVDFWDGKDDMGQLQPHGAYYAVLEYVVGTETRFVDLTDQTGTHPYAPPRPTPAAIFSPFENDPLEIDFTIPVADGASEVLAVIGLALSGERLITLVNREPFGVGDHRLIWDGTDPAGNIAQPPPGDGFLVGVLANRLPKNAIMLQAAPTISDVSVSPNLFDPATPDHLSPANPVAEITYSLDKTANVELTVTNLATGVVLRQVVDSLVPPGAGHVIAWDGKAADGRFADRGSYRVALRATDSTGGVSLVRYVLMRVSY